MELRYCRVAAFAALCAFCAEASEYSLDFTGASPLACEAPVLRKARMDVSSLAALPPRLAEGDGIRLRLFDDVSFCLKVVSVPPAGIAGQSYIARDEVGSASAIVKVSKGVSRISVDDFTRRRQYAVHGRDGVATVTERDNSRADGGECGTCGGSVGVVPARLGEGAAGADAGKPDGAADARPKAGALLGSSPSFPLAAQKTVVDVLVAFDRGARDWAEADGRWDTLEDCAEDSVQRMNAVLRNSGLVDDFSYRLVGTTVIDDTDTDVGSSLGKCRDGLGAYARLRAEQAACGADVPVALIDTGSSAGTRGVSYGLTGTNMTTVANFWDDAFASCHIESSFSEYTMTHEVGHLLGAGHSNLNYGLEGWFDNEPGYKGRGSPQSCDCSAGYHFTATNGLYHTIMGYNNCSDGRRYAPTPYFSSPEISPPEHGVAIGTPTNDNVRVLRQTCAPVSGWRKAVVPGPDDVSAFDAQGREILDGRIFVGTLSVSLSSGLAGAAIYYTTDGSTPNSGSSLYDGPFDVADTAVVSVAAVTNGVAASIRSFKVFKVDSPVAANDPSIAWRTSSAYPWLYTAATDWSGNDKQVIRGGLSGNMHGETFLKAEVEGPKRISFRVKSKFYYSKSTVPSQYSTQYTHCNFFVDEKSVVTMEEPQEDWSIVKANIPDGTHTLLFSFIQQTAKDGANDGMWINDMRLDDPSAYVHTWQASGGKGAISGGWDSVPPAGDDAVIALSEDTVLTVDVAMALGQVRLRSVSSEPVALTLSGGEALSISELCIPLDVTLHYDPSRLDAAKVTGEGVVVCDGFKPSESAGWSDGSAWRGTVWIKNISGGTSANKGPAWDFNPGAFGNQNSTVRLTGVAGHFPKQQLAIRPVLELVDDGATAALTLNNGYSYDSRNDSYARILHLAGSGTLRCGGSADNVLVNVIDAAGFAGTLDIANKAVYFGEGIPSASQSPQVKGTIVVNKGAEVAIPGGRTWTAGNGASVAGTLHVKGADAAITCGDNPTMGLSLSDGAALRFDAGDAKLTFGRNLAFSGGTVEMAFADGVTPADGATLLAWPSASTISGRFKLVGAATNDYEIATNATGLVFKAKPSDRIDLSGYSYLTEEMLGDWLEENNFEFYEYGWKSFMSEVNYRNGYSYLDNYLLGYFAEDNRAFAAKIGFDAVGNVVITTTEGTVPPVRGLVKRLYSKRCLADPWTVKTVPFSSENTTTVENPGSAGFYKVEISVE